MHLFQPAGNQLCQAGQLHRIVRHQFSLYGRCPLYADGAQAARWCASASAEDPAAVAAEIEAAAQTNALGLVTGAAKRGAVTQSRTLQDFWGAAAPKKKAKAEASPVKAESPPEKAEAPPVKTEAPPAVKKKEPAEVIEID